VGGGGGWVGVWGGVVGGGGGGELRQVTFCMMGVNWRVLTPVFPLPVSAAWKTQHGIVWSKCTPLHRTIVSLETAVGPSVKQLVTMEIFLQDSPRGVTKM